MSGEELKPAAWLYEKGAYRSVKTVKDGVLVSHGCTETPLYARPLPEQPQEGWRTMDSAPKDRCILLASLAVANAGQGPEWAITAGYWDAEFEWDNDEHRGAWTDDTVASWGYQERVELSPSRWMPLPTPPSTETKESGE